MGRAALALIEHGPEPYLPELIGACLTDGAFHMSESERVPYLFRLVELARAEEALLDAILAAIPTDQNTTRDLRQRLGLLAEFTKRGHPRAKVALLAQAMRDEEAVTAVASLGATALKWLIAVRPELFTVDRYGDISYWISLAEEASGKEAVESVLTEPIWEARREWQRRAKGAEDLPWIVKLSELEEKFCDPAFRSQRRRLAWRFGVEASEVDFRAWATRMLDETAPATLWDMSVAFRKRPWPLAVEPIFFRIDGEDRGAEAWRRVLERAEGAEVREFALQRLRMDPPDEDAIAFLTHAFVPGDESVVLAALQRVDPEDLETCHSLGLDLRKLIEESAAERFVPHLEWAIEHNPCSFCRTFTMETLIKIDALRPEYRREAAYDAEPDTRALVANER